MGRRVIIGAIVARDHLDPGKGKVVAIIMVLCTNRSCHIMVLLLGGKQKRKHMLKICVHSSKRHHK
jgi:hypothetical protein